MDQDDGARFIVQDLGGQLRGRGDIKGPDRPRRLAHWLSEWIDK
jgi:hypothetical protein